MDSDQRWFVVYTHPRDELKAFEHLMRQGFNAFLPMYRKSRRHARKVENVRAPLFPRYLFVAMDLTRTRWRSILSTIGVAHLICRDDRPVPVPVGVVEDIRARLKDDGLVKIDPGFRRGDALQVTEGAFANQVGLFEGLADRDRVVLLLQMLGRPVSVQVPLHAVTSPV